jgi:hypothetical protein
MVSRLVYMAYNIYRVTIDLVENYFKPSDSFLLSTNSRLNNNYC